MSHLSRIWRLKRALLVVAVIAAGAVEVSGQLLAAQQTHNVIGRVVMDRTPVYGAIVRVFALDITSFTLTPLAGDGLDAVTDAKGEFSISLPGTIPDPSLVKVGWILQATTMESGPATVALEPNLSGAIVLQLSARQMRLAGRVIDDEGQPVRNAQLTSLPMLGNSFAFDLGRSDDRGMFSLRVPANAASYKLFVRAEGLADSLLEIADVSKPLTVQMVKGMTLHGVIVDKDADMPLANCLVTARFTLGLPVPIRVSARTNAEGEFVLPPVDISARIYDVSVEHDGYATRRLKFVSGNNYGPIALERAFKVEIRFEGLLENSNEPVAIRLEEAAHIGAAVAEAVSDRGGNVTIWAPPGNYRITAATSSLPLVVQVINLRSDLNLTVRFPRPKQLRGTVLWTDGRPAGSVKLDLTPLDGPTQLRQLGGTRVMINRFGADQRTITTSDDGTFAVQTLAAGTYQIQLSARTALGNPDPGGLFPDTIEVSEDSEAPELLYMIPAPTHVRLHFNGVSDLDSARVRVISLDSEGSDISEFGPRTVDVVNGVAELGSVISGRYRFEVAADNYVFDDEVVSIAGDEQIATLQPSRGYRVEGRVIDESGAAIADMTVDIWRVQPGDVSFGNSANDLTSKTARTDDGGAFSFEGVGPGTYLVSTSSGTLHPAVAEVQVKPGGGLVHVDLRLRNGFDLNLKIVGKDGKPLPPFSAILIARQSLDGGAEYRGIQLACEPADEGCAFEHVVEGIYVLRIVMLADGATTEVPQPVEVPVLVRDDTPQVIVVK